MRSNLLLQTVLGYGLSLLLIGCGGGSGGSTTTNNTPSTSSPIAANNLLTITVRMPMKVEHAHLTIRVTDDNTPLYDNADFSDFDAVVTNLALSNYANKILVVTLSPNANSTIYDPVLDKPVPYNSGSLHALATINTLNQFLNLSPLSEAIYQRTLVRADNIDTTQAADLLKIQPKHIIKATDEVNKALAFSFNASQLPRFSSPISNWQAGDNSNNDYVNVFKGLGLLQEYVNRFPQTINSYVMTAQSLGTDLRDGSLDGRSIVGDTSSFNPIIKPAAPYNLDVSKNTLLDIGATQANTRTAFGESLKQATLDYAYKHAQNIINPNYYALLQTTTYYEKTAGYNSYDSLRWNGAGDYRRAFGLLDSYTDICANMSRYPCKQGLNADDINNSTSDIEYLIGQHTVGNCKVNIRPSGAVSVQQGNQQYNNAINRDASDNLQRINAGHYLLNIGNSNATPIEFIQLDIQDLSIKTVKIGTANNLYPSTLDTVTATCSS